MVEHFRQRYRTKTREELEHIASAPESFVPAAVKVAIQLLNEKHGMQIPLPFPEVKINRYEEDYTTYKHYFKTFSVREVTSALSLAVLFIGAHSILNYIRDAKGVDENFSLIQFLLLVLVFTLSNIIYKREHGRRNLLVGRLLQNTFLCVCILLLISLRNWLMGSGVTLFNDDAVAIMFGFTIIILFAEGIVSIVRRILTLKVTPA